MTEQYRFSDETPDVSHLPRKISISLFDVRNEIQTIHRCLKVLVPYLGYMDTESVIHEVFETTCYNSNNWDNIIQYVDNTFYVVHTLNPGIESEKKISEATSDIRKAISKISDFIVEKLKEARLFALDDTAYYQLSDFRHLILIADKQNPEDLF